jgi:carboxylesterase type B
LWWTKSLIQSKYLRTNQAYGGNYGKDAKDNGAPFDKAILQSPGFLPIVSNVQQEQTFFSFLTLANVSTIEEARQLPTEVLIRANLLQVANSPSGSFTFGPVVDGDFVPALPGLLLSRGMFDTSVKVMVGHNANEGLLFTSYLNDNETEFEINTRETLPTISDASLEYITQTLYPEIYDGSHGYTEGYGRASLAASELGFVCNTWYLDTAFKNKTYSYHFSIPPALHGYDVPYTFYNDGGLDPNEGILSVDAALTLQDWIITFTKTGVPTSPNVPSTPPFPVYGADNKVVNIGLNSITIETDDAANPRCAWWQKALFV